MPLCEFTGPNGVVFLRQEAITSIGPAEIHVPTFPQETHPYRLVSLSCSGYFVYDTPLQLRRLLGEP